MARLKRWHQRPPLTLGRLVRGGTRLLLMLFSCPHNSRRWERQSGVMCLVCNKCGHSVPMLDEERP